MSLRYLVIDVFTAEKYAGNPAAIVLDADGLDDATMSSIAAEFNLGITVFVLRARQNHANAPAIRLRWFTPAGEIRMCGHGSIAAIHALLETGAIQHSDPANSTTVKIETVSGRLDAFVESIPGQSNARIIWLDLLDPTWKRLDFDAQAWSAALGASETIWDVEFPPVKTQDNDLLTFVQDFAVLNGLRPNHSAIAELSRTLGIRGLCVSTVRTVTPSAHVQSRFFAPSIGLNEDSVTGSVHGPLSAYLVDRGAAPRQNDLAGLTCVQGIAGGRTGLLHALVQCHDDGTYAVRIGGRAVTTMSGTLAP